ADPIAVQSTGVLRTCLSCAICSGDPMKPAASPLPSDLYQFIMIEDYLEDQETKTAVFEFFVRKHPPQRGFLSSAAPGQLLEFLETLRVSAEELGWLACRGCFGKRRLDYLAQTRFTGDVHAMPGGTASTLSDVPVLDRACKVQSYAGLPRRRRSRGKATWPGG